MATNSTSPVTLMILSLVLAGAVAHPRLAAQANPAEPCCQITSINANGLVAARQTANGQVFQFQVKDKAQLATLHIGQAIWANFAGQAVALAAGAQPCCEIVAAGAGAAVGPQQLQPAGAQPCCQIVANAALTGRLGRLLVAFPEGANAGSSRVDVFKAGQTASLQGGFGAQAMDLLPGTYTVVVSGARVEGVPVQSGHDTQLRVGILRIKAGANTRADVLAADGKTTLTSGFGAQVIGLPVGTYRVQIAGQSETVTIHDSKITDF